MEERTAHSVSKNTGAEFIERRFILIAPVALFTLMGASIKTFKSKPARVVSCRVVSCRVVSCRVVSRRVASRRVVSCRVVSRRVVSCRVVSFPVAYQLKNDKRVKEQTRQRIKRKSKFVRGRFPGQKFATSDRWRTKVRNCKKQPIEQFSNIPSPKY